MTTPQIVGNSYHVCLSHNFSAKLPVYFSMSCSVWSLSPLPMSWSYFCLYETVRGCLYPDFSSLAARAWWLPPSQFLFVGQNWVQSNSHLFSSIKHALLLCSSLWERKLLARQVRTFRLIQTPNRSYRKLIFTASLASCFSNVLFCSECSALEHGRIILTRP